MSTELSTGDAPTASPRWRRWLNGRTVVGLLALVAIVGGLIAFDRLTGSTVGPLDSRTPQIGEPAPAFALRDPDGGLTALSDFEGRPVWINFWATWCGPCRRELPDIQALAREFEAQGLVVLALNVEESETKAVDFWEELGLELPMLLDEQGDVAEQYRLRGMPNNFFIDEDGVLRELQLGFLTEGQMRDKLASIGVQ